MATATFASHEEADTLEVVFTKPQGGEVAFRLHIAAIAILADISHLALPTGIQGIVGLRFLRHFHRWGGERTDSGVWRFFLTTDST